VKFVYLILRIQSQFSNKESSVSLFPSRVMVFANMLRVSFISPSSVEGGVTVQLYTMYKYIYTM